MKATTALLYLGRALIGGGLQARPGQAVPSSIEGRQGQSAGNTLLLSQFPLAGPSKNSQLLAQCTECSGGG